MKDATHHLKHVQRKVIQTARKEERNIKQTQSKPVEQEMPEKKVLVNGRRNNRLPGISNIH